MDQLLAVLQVVAPIFTAVALGVLARRKQLLTPEENRGLQQYVLNLGLPCVLFNSCLTAQMGAEAVTSMAMLIPLLLLSALWAFRARKGKHPYHNLPMLFAAQETGMLGIPLLITLFGESQAWRMGVLDLAQVPIAIPVMAILSSNAGENPTLSDILKKVFRSPLLLTSVLGLILNLSGIGAWLDGIGVGPVITGATGFVAQPVSAAMLFSVGYNFSLGEGNRKAILRIALTHLGMLALFCLAMQGMLFFVPDVDVLTRWTILLYCALPASYIAPSLGRTDEDRTVASSVCSVLTVLTLVIFCLIAAMTA